ncbi:hypothetical protein D3C81_1371930 [compost metagenome]
MAALGIDQHGIDAERVDLPLPPGAHVLGTPNAVQGFTLLEHQALDTQAARLLALAGEVSPVRAIKQGRKQHRGQWVVFHQPFQLPAALVLRPVAPVLALPLQQVVGLQDHRGIAQQFFAQRLAPDALL